MTSTARWTGLDTVIDALSPDLFKSPESLLLSPDEMADPFGRLASIRDRYGFVVDRSEAANLWEVPNFFLLDESNPIYLVLGFEEATEAYRHPAVRTGYAGSIEHVFGRSMTMMDGEEHARIRALAQHAFRRSAVDRWIEEEIRPTTAHLVSRLAERGEGDLIRDLSAPLAFSFMCRMFGLADDQFERFVRIASALLHIAYDFDGAMAARDELTAFLQEEIDQRRRTPTNDMIGLLVSAEVDDERLTDEEILSNLRQLIPAGIETTFRSAGNMWALLLGDPSQFAAVVSDPDLGDAAVEEALRLQGPAVITPRIASEDVDLNGTTVPAGCGMLVSQGAANRDPRRWDDADRYDVYRSHRPHLAFISGAHTCIGLHLARAEMREAVVEVSKRLPTLHLTGTVESLGVMLRSPEACPVAVH